MTTETNNTPRRRPDGWPLTVPYRPEPPEKATTAFLNRALFHRYQSYFSPDDRTLALKLEPVMDLVRLRYGKASWLPQAVPD
jgi:hypothetical protein